MKRFLIGGTHSGCGKTTVTCALLSALCGMGLRVSAFKCGPDYIDPMFFSKITNTPAHNLDSFFCADNILCHILAEYSKNADISVIEGVMGFYDGARGRGSAHSVSLITDTPAVLVVDCKGIGESLGAVMSGFLGFEKPNNIIGFIFNRLSERQLPLAKDLCARLGTRCFGFLPKTDIVFESRRLGLVTADEIAEIEEKLRRLGELARENILLDELLDACERPAPRSHEPEIRANFAKTKPLIAVSKDAAFCFEYAENLELLEKLGCRLAFFSPLTDKNLPKGCAGLILCGGYPELYAERLSENVSMLDEIRSAAERKMPMIAECGGFIYLHEQFQGENGKFYRGAGVIPSRAYKTDRLSRFGYVKLTAERDNLLCKAGHTLAAHEYHYWDSEDCGGDFLAEKTNGTTYKCAHAAQRLYAGFPHFYFYADVSAAEGFVAECEKFAQSGSLL